MLREPLIVSSSRYALALPRIKLQILTGLLAGHSYLNRHLYTMKISDNELCPLCEEEEEHVYNFLQGVLQQ